jgi:membrane-associated protease RseP (regulator of RpoE activity)
MILVAILFHEIGHRIPVWLKKQTITALRQRLDTLRFIFEMSGVLMNFILAFLLILGITLTSKEKYLLNKDAIYGIQANETTEQLGFKDGDKVVSINGKNVTLFSDIFTMILVEPNPIQVAVQRQDSMLNIQLPIDFLGQLISSGRSSTTPIFSPKTALDSATGRAEPLKWQEKRGTFSEAVHTYVNMFKLVKSIFVPRIDAYRGIGSIKSIDQIKSVKGYLYLFAFSSIVLGLFNLLPIPGMDIGNTLIALIERLRKRKFDEKKLRIVRWVGAGLVVVALVIWLYWQALY